LKRPLGEDGRPERSLAGPERRLAWITRTEQLVAVLTVLAMAANRLWLVDLMRLLGVRGAFVDLAMFSPVLLLGVRHRRQLLRRESASLICVVAYTCTTATWSGHHIDSAVKALHIAVMIALLACFRGSVAFVRTVGAASAIGSMLIPIYVLGRGKAWLDTWTDLPPLGIAIMLHLHRRANWRTLPLLAAVIVSTLRAAIIGSVAGLSLALFRSRLGLAVVGAAAIAGTIAFANTESAYRNPMHVEREDIIGRLHAIQDDGASHRFDLWRSLLQDISERDPLSREMLIGHGLGDVNYYVAEVFPLVAVEEREHEPMASSHNTLIELALVGGLAMIPLVLWMIVDIVRFVHIRDMTLPIAVIVAFIGGGNEILLNLAGGSALIAFLFGILNRENVAARGAPAPSTRDARRLPARKAGGATITMLPIK
jgi:hypothetical protein